MHVNNLSKITLTISLPFYLQYAWAPSCEGDRSAHYFNKVPSLLLGNHIFPGAMPPPWPIETTFVVAVGYHNGTLQA